MTNLNIAEKLIEDVINLVQSRIEEIAKEDRGAFFGILVQELALKSGASTADIITSFEKMKIEFLSNK
jgi:hypothetical protein